MADYDEHEAKKKELMGDIMKHFDPDNPEHAAALDMAADAQIKALAKAHSIISGKAVAKKPKSRAKPDTPESNEIKQRISRAAKGKNHPENDLGAAIKKVRASKPTGSGPEVKSPLLFAPSVVNPFQATRRAGKFDDHSEHYNQAVDLLDRIASHRSEMAGTTKDDIAYTVHSMNLDDAAADLHALAHKTNSRKVLKMIAATHPMRAGSVAKRKLLNNRIPFSGTKLDEQRSKAEEMEAYEQHMAERVARGKAAFSRLIQQTGKLPPPTKPGKEDSAKKNPFKGLIPGSK